MSKVTKKKTLEALKQSIRKYEGALKGKLIQLGPEGCPLCKLFFDNEHCEDCPVRERTGHYECRDTPYQEVAALSGQAIGDDFDYRYRYETPEQKKAIRAEIRFLKSLLPKKETK